MEKIYLVYGRTEKEAAQMMHNASGSVSRGKYDESLEKGISGELFCMKNVRCVTKSSATQTEDRKATVQVSVLDADFHETETVYDVRFSLFKPGEEIPSGLHVVVNTINWALDITATGCP